MRPCYGARVRVQSITLSRGAADAVRRGHPWVYRDQITGDVSGATTGDELSVLEDGKPLARALFDADSPLALRVWTRGEAIDPSLFAKRAASAIAIRSALFSDGRTTAYRLIHGEGDRMPGVVVDLYGDVAVLRLDGAAIASRIEPIVGAIWPLIRDRAKTLLLRRTDRAEGDKTTVVEGPNAPEHIEVTEHGVRFVVDVLRGQKTGAFLDQRENRARVGAMARGKRVLNLFSYAGGFSLHAALGGATRVTSVDIAAAAHATAQARFRASGVDPGKHAFIAADAYAFLDNALRKREQYDLVISDPPSFAPAEKAVPRALAAYKKLHYACVRVLAEGGTFCASSCSSHIGAARFMSTLDDASLGTSALRLAALHGHPEDHPTLAAWPEGAYLKMAVLR